MLELNGDLLVADAPRLPRCIVASIELVPALRLATNAARRGRGRDTHAMLEYGYEEFV